jgi:uncharacterized membrane protein YdjX (TVP38/TMEM64 family)
MISLLAGPLFGLVGGSIIVSIASTLGGGLAFLVARYGLRDYFLSSYQGQMTTITSGFQQKGWWYLVSMRLNPFFPFFIANIAMAFTSMSFGTYMLISFVAMVPGNIVYVNAGLRLTEIESAADIISPSIAVSLVLLCVLPLLGPWLSSRLSRVPSSH